MLGSQMCVILIKLSKCWSPPPPSLCSIQHPLCTPSETSTVLQKSERLPVYCSQKCSLGPIFEISFELNAILRPLNSNMCANRANVDSYFNRARILLFFLYVIIVIFFMFSFLYFFTIVFLISQSPFLLLLPLLLIWIKVAEEARSGCFVARASP